jgi:hypothetical protein
LEKGDGAEPHSSAPEKTMTQLKSIKSVVPAGYFGEAPQTRRPLGSGPLLQWFNGLPAGRAIAVGWHIQASRCPEQLTQALHRRGFERLTVLHKMSGEMVEYWSLETCSLIVLCNGFADPWEMRQTCERDGIAYGWLSAKNASKVKARVLVAELAEAGYTEQLTVTLEGHLTSDWFKALEQQFRVLDACEHITGMAAPFYGFSLTMMPAEKPRIVGPRKEKQSPIVPIMAQVPPIVDEEYLAAHLCSKEVLDFIASHDLINKAVKWSIDTSERISRNEDRESWETPEYEEAVSAGKGTTQRPGPVAAHLAPEQGSEQAMPASKAQVESIAKLCQRLEKPVPGEVLSFEQAKVLLAQLSAEYNRSRQSRGNGK